MKPYALPQVESEDALFNKLEPLFATIALDKFCVKLDTPLENVSSDSQLKPTSQKGSVSFDGLEVPFLDGSMSSSKNSVPQFECTPEIVDDVTTPNISNLSLDLMDEERNFVNIDPELIRKDTSMQKVKDILKNVGYTLPVIENIVKKFRVYCDMGNYGRSRPKTQIFSQGKVFTYEKLEVPTECLPEKNSVRSSTTLGIDKTQEKMELNPRAATFVPSREQANIRLTKISPLF